MTREQWLNTALSGLAPRVRERLRAEYEAHMLDMQDGGQPEWLVRQSFGDPVQVNRELKEEYLTEWEAGVIANRSRLWTVRTPWQPLLMGVVGVLAPMLLGGLFGVSISSRWWLPLVVGMLGSAWLHHLSRTLPPEQLALRGSAALNYLFFVVMLAMQSLNWTEDWWISATLLFVVGTLFFLWYEFGLNGALHRKLRAEPHPVNTPHSR